MHPGERAAGGGVEQVTLHHLIDARGLAGHRAGGQPSGRAHHGLDAKGLGQKVADHALEGRPAGDPTHRATYDALDAGYVDRPVDGGVVVQAGLAGLAVGRREALDDRATCATQNAAGDRAGRTTNGPAAGHAQRAGGKGRAAFSDAAEQLTHEPRLRGR
jgi:hypothetical protein